MAQDTESLVRTGRVRCHRTLRVRCFYKFVLLSAYGSGAHRTSLVLQDAESPVLLQVYVALCVCVRCAQDASGMEQQSVRCYCSRHACVC